MDFHDTMQWHGRLHNAAALLESAGENGDAVSCLPGSNSAMAASGSIVGWWLPAMNNLAGWRDDETLQTGFFVIPPYGGELSFS